MIKHTQQQPTNYLSVFDYFVGLAVKGLRGYLGPCQASMIDPIAKIVSGQKSLIIFSK